ncbi:type I phosphomannose isomerase catalytic subunit [Granulicella arctica]|uniref:type I phosphomannose isomerase catalytic subunit n=1 Tax=Granulicella arctica TaxID=940613 RepID=UPI0021DF4389|nr:type I phosphomannose isomerase catalytic subunit [Granulicella arctica]
MTELTKLAPFRLAPYFSERIWGKKSLEPWYASTGTTELVGEAWLTGPASVIETGELAGKTLAEAIREDADAVIGPKGDREFPLLVKILFPNEKLSVQVHPDDVQAQAIGQPRGKTECWYVLEAEPGASVMLGLTPGAGPDQVRAAVAGGTMEQLMQHVPVAVGDMVFVDAGTVHAIAPGVTLLETQQTSDTTYRLYDYGRPRELHVEQSLGVMKTTTKAGKIAPHAMDGFTRLIDEQYFSVDRFDLAGGSLEVAMESVGCLVGLKGTGSVDGVEFKAGQAVIVPLGLGKVQVEAKADFAFARCLSPVS